MMNLERSQDLLPSLATFVAVVESNGFAAAARRLGMTRSAVSKQVARLEEEWGVKLLRRTTRAVSLTEPGQQAYEHASQISKLAAMARESAASLSRAPRGLLRATASVSFGQRFLVPLLPAFRERHPEVEVELHLLDRMVDLVEEGFDVAIRLSRRLPEGMVAKKLGDVRYRLCASPRLAGVAAAKTPGDVESLPALRLAGRRAKEPWILSRGQERAEVLPEGPVRANTSDALLELAIAGLGVALLPDYVHSAALARGELVELLPGWTVEGPYGDAFWAVRPERRALPKVSAFVEFLADAAKGGAPAPARPAQAGKAVLARAA
ncbi:LysR family transcriptional regulator [Ramlibacter sp. PS3R-8]|uniref:LysR family transcriptional regulator n=1 Tax=Ramlibacter sp. PS3R-8 TaxID=3133437 RepID=UPI0030AC81C5